MKIVAKNRRARFDYEILETIVAGIVLSGQEAKSCREGHIDLSGSYVSFHGGKPQLKQAKIRPYPFASGLTDYNPGRDRQLLLGKKEAETLRTMLEQKGISIIPLEVQAGRYIKVVLALARGRKTIDKRKVMKERDIEKRLRQGREI